MKKIYGVFASTQDAADAFDRLCEIGYTPSDISVIAMREEVRETRRGDGRVAHAAEPTVAERTTSGVISGAAAGGLLGLLVGVAAIAIPGLGGLLVAGPVATALGLTGTAATVGAGVATGALAGGLVGGLTNLGIPEETARTYETRIKQGGVVLGADVQDDKMEEVRNIFNSEGANDVTVVG